MSTDDLFRWWILFADSVLLIFGALCFWLFLARLSDYIRDLREDASDRNAPERLAQRIMQLPPEDRAQLRRIVEKLLDDQERYSP